MGLSATPIYNYGDEIFNVMNILRPDALGSYSEFRDEWCRDVSGGKLALREPKAFGTWARDQGLLVRHTREEVGRELPAVTRIVERVDVNQAALQAVEGRAAELAARLLAPNQVRGEAMQAAEELSMIVRRATGVAKAPYVADFVRFLVESTGEKILLVGWHHDVYDIWEERLTGLRVARFTGLETAAQKNQAADAFMKGELDVLMLSLRAGAGVDGLQQAGSVVVFGELDWSPGVHEQVIGRLARDGQSKGVLAYYMLADEGSDPVVSSVLGVKREQVEGIRNPQGGVLDVVEADGERVKRLAEQYLHKVSAT